MLERRKETYINMQRSRIKRAVFAGVAKQMRSITGGKQVRVSEYIVKK